MIWPLDLTSRLGIASGEPRPYTSYIDRSGALRVFNNSDRHDRPRIHSFLSSYWLLSCWLITTDDRQTDSIVTFLSKSGRTLPHILWHSTWGRRQALWIGSPALHTQETHRNVLQPLKTVKSPLPEAVKSPTGTEIRHGTTSDVRAGITIIKIS